MWGLIHRATLVWVSLIKSASIVSLLTLLSRITGLVRELLVASTFGASAMTDAFNVAFRIPNLLRDLFAEGALSSAFVPTFSDAMVKGGQERAYRLGNLVLGGLLLVTGGLTLAGFIWSDALVSLITRGFGGNAALAAAAYNAGPGRARKWCDAKPLEGAIYVETIPFAETRQYVKKVMANAVYYAALSGGEQRSLKSRLGTIGGVTAMKNGADE